MAPLIPRGNDDDGHDDGHSGIAIAPSTSTSAHVDCAAAAAAVDVTSCGPQRSRVALKIMKAAALLLLVVGLAGSASTLLAVQSHPEIKAKAAVTAIMASWSALQQQQEKLPALQRSLSSTLQNVPRISRGVFEGTKATAVSIQAFSAESAELAWEKSENAFHQLRQYHYAGYAAEALEEEKHNPLERALGGVFHLRKNDKRGDRKGGNKNLRDFKNKHARGGGGGNTNSNKQNRRNLKAEQQQADTSRKSSSNEEQSNNIPWDDFFKSLLSKSPLAAPLLAFCALVYLMASLITNWGGRNSNDTATVILDENEAEIVEFYEKEKEMECGTLFQLQSHHQTHTIPFFQSDVENKGMSGRESERERECHPIRRASERNFSDSSLARYHLPQSYGRSSSDSALVRHQSAGIERKESFDYSTMLKDIETLNYENEVDLVLGEDKEASEPDTGCDRQECQIALMEEIPSVAEDESRQSDEQPSLPQSQLTAGVEEDDTRVESAQEAIEEEPQCSQSTTPFSCSSISSLTSEGCAIEELPAGSSCQEEEDQNKKAQYGESSMPGEDEQAVPAPLTRSMSLNDYYSYHNVTSTGVTPPMSNLYQDNKRSLLKKDGKRLGGMKRSVSFHSTVQVREIPRETAKNKHANEIISAESYLYIMLFTVAIAIATFSLMPANPSLSPMHTMTRGDILQRAETMLSSQWDVEL